MSYTFQPHVPRKTKCMPWVVCIGCGLVFLKNAETAEAVRLGCNWDEHPKIVAERRSRCRGV